ncbi:NAD(P)H-hydrate dehydratase [Lysobacter pythonis]|uniref:Bifunctional NAD(P)H-hydrate repair enzyme n=1 Tax=Solilutibacter pythonis TaxID=2483112 RepID=A0A3M2HTD2_9GAMM|nr:NAD(P)H-hydrate dehydratase [Lysobacter pythonis]RMH93006.1 NAD(P)H-hydrate dehydratase [Lysobacter pythonis]
MQSLSALYDNAALRELEKRACAEPDIDDTTLMRRAGQAAWRCLLEHWPNARRIVVLAGPGNNGGDGWVLARHARDSGLDVCVVHPSSMPPRTPLAMRMAGEYADAGGRAEAFSGVLPVAEVIVDALFGIGLDRAPEGETASMIAAANAASSPILALDVPSGIDSERGAVPGVAIFAAHTIQFIAAHIGLATGAALDHVGSRSLSTLDAPAACFDGFAPKAEVAASPRFPRRARDSHKGRHGHVLAIGGEHGYGGAILIAAESALRGGAGLVSVATRAEHVAALLTRRPEAMGHAVEVAVDLQPLLEHADALALGPGLGRGEWSHGLFEAALASGKPCVVDADALNLLAAAPRPLPGAVLTPHPGEAARLLGSDTASVQRDRYAAAEAIAARYGGAVVLKGAGSVIAAPGRTSRVLAVGNPGMASGGMGDALSGVIASLLAQGAAPFEAASAGAWLHGRAGDLAARDGEAGLLAGDLIGHLRAAIAECTA